MQTTAKRIVALCSMVVMLVLVASISAVPALAAGHGIYVASAHPSYRNPSTGQIEDSGGDGNEALGQGMTESVTHNKALVEVDQNGNTYVTIRMKMMENINGVSFQVDGASASYTCMQEGGSTADFRMRVNSESSLIRCSMYVAPMGRDVVFFIKLSNLQPGSGDFITSIEVAPPETEAPAEPTEPEVKPTEPKATEPKAAEPKATQPKPAATEAKETTPEPAVTENPASTAAETTVPADTQEPTEALGLQEFDASGNAVEETKPETQQHGSSMATALWVILGVAAAGGIGFCVWYFCFFQKKK